MGQFRTHRACLLYKSDAADDLTRVDLGEGRWHWLTTVSRSLSHAMYASLQYYHFTR